MSLLLHIAFPVTGTAGLPRPLLTAGAFVLGFLAATLCALALSLLSRKRRSPRHAGVDPALQSTPGFSVTPSLMVLLRSEDGLVRNANTEFLETTGFKRDDVLGKSLDRLGIMPSFALLRLRTRVVRNAGHLRNVEICFRTRHSHRRWARLGIDSIDVEGERCLFVSALDTTDHRLAVGALQESERRYRQLFEGSLDGFVLIDAAGRFLDANESFQQMVGYDLQTLQGTTTCEITPPEWMEWERDHSVQDQLLTRGRSAAYEKEFIHCDGTRIPVEIALSALPDREPGQEVFWGVVRDIRERRRAEEELQRSEERLELALAGGDLVTWDWDLQADCYIIDWRHLALLGYGPQDMDGQMQRWESLIHPGDLEVFRKAIRAHAEGVTPTYEAEYRVRTRSGEWKRVLDRGKAVERNDSDEALRITGTRTDITRRRWAEEALRDSETQMRAILSALPDLVLVVDPNGECRDVYSTEAPLLTVPAGEAPGLDVGSIVPSEVSKSVLSVVAGARDDNAIRRGQCEANIMGTRRWFALCAVAFQSRWGKRVLFMAHDITDLREAEQALAESEVRFSAIFHQSPLLLGVLDTEGRILQLNQTALDSVHAEPHRLAGTLFIDSPWWAGEPKSREQLGQALVRAAHGTVSRFEATHQLPRGRNVEVDVNIAPVRNREGEVRLLVVQGLDITDRKRAEQALRRSEERLQLILEATRDGIWDFNPVSGAIYFSPRWYTMLGYQPDELAMSYDTWRNLLHPEDREKTESTFWQSVRQANPLIAFDFRMRARDGEWLWIHSRGKAAEFDDEGNVTRILGTHSDITDRKQVENSLRQSEQRYRSLVENIDLGVALVGQDLRFGALNRAYARIAGHPVHNLIGQWCHKALRDHSGPCPDCPGQIALESGQAAESEFHIGKPNGETRIIHARAFPLHSEDGQPRGFIEVIEDVTARRSIEQEARVREQQLIQADKMISLGILVSGVAHEINNPNNFIMLNSSILKRTWTGLVPLLDRYQKEHGEFLLEHMPFSRLRDHVPRLLDGLVEGAERIKSIVSNLKDFARQEAPEVRAEIDLNAVLSSALVLLSNLTRKSTNCLEVHTAPDLPTVHGNFQRLEQVIINLVQNACQALPDPSKGICISTTCEPPHAVLEVRDEGVGMSEDILRHIMDPFFTTKRDSGGTGLGLSVSAGIASEHGGRLEFSSSPGDGTTARLILPKSGSAVPVSSSAAEPRKTRATNRRPNRHIDARDQRGEQTENA